jgi:small subunit ribosomal protein S17
MKILTGTVVSNKMDKSIVVEVERLWQHPVYKKRLKRSSKFTVHAEKPVNIGDTVVIKESKPISKTKSWILVSVTK